MASGFVSDFNVTDASNTSFAGISQAENVMLPSNVNDDFRAKDGAFARWLNDLGSTATVGGTANAITVTLAQPFTGYGSSAGQIPNGAIIAIKPTAANTGAVAIVVNSLTSKAIRSEGDVALIGGELAANGAYLLKYDTAYNSAAGAWVLLNPTQTFRARLNRLINGDFDFWQRGTGGTISSGVVSFDADRWASSRDGTGATVTTSRQAHTIGQTAVPGNPTYFRRFAQTVAGSGGTFNIVFSQKIEGVSTLSGKLVTVTFYAQADATRALGLSLVQNFGTGGSPSTAVTTSGSSSSLTTAFAKYAQTITLPSISGKTLGSSGGDNLQLIFTAPLNTAQTIDISHVSLVEGDSTQEADPFNPRLPAEEFELCERFYEKSYAYANAPGSAPGAGNNVLQFDAPSNAIHNYSPFHTKKRGNPAVVVFDGAGTSSKVSYFISSWNNGGAVTAVAGYESGIFVQTNIASSIIVSYDYTADAEL